MKIIEERKLVGSQASKLELCEQVIASIIAIFIVHTEEKFLEDTKTCIYNARHFVKCKFCTIYRKL